MLTLQQARISLNEIDAKMVSLFEAYQIDQDQITLDKLNELKKSRLAIIYDVAIYKHQNNLAIYDPKREQELIAKNLALLQDKKNESDYLRFINEILEDSKRLQNKIITSLDHDE